VTIIRSIMQQLPGGRSLLVVLVIASVTLTACVSPLKLSNKYTFQDEFDGTAGAGPNPAKWSYDIGGGGWGNNELQSYTDSRENSFLDGKGHLVIRATKTVKRDSNGRPIDIHYNSARLKTLGHFSQAKGRWEARIQINSERGLWPAWWTLGQNYPIVGWPQSGEVDIAEDYGFSRVESSIHAPQIPLGHTTCSDSVSIGNGFHVFRLDWTTSGFTFYKDGVKYATMSSTNSFFDFRQPMFMLLNLAVGGSIGNPPEDIQFPVDFLIDYVRVWS